MADDDNIDPLVTQCPNCDTRFRVTQAQLQLAAGRVRCGACLAVFLATDSLQVGGERDAPEPDAESATVDAVPDEIPAETEIDVVAEPDLAGLNLKPLQAAGTIDGEAVPHRLAELESELLEGLRAEGAETTSAEDTVAEDTGAEDTAESAEDTVAEDTAESAEDTGAEDTAESAEDTGAEDTAESAEDTGAEDTAESAEDTGAEDTAESAEDTVAEDTGAEDTGAEDTGAEDTGAEDTAESAEDTVAEDTVESAEAEDVAESVEDIELVATDTSQPIQDWNQDDEDQEDQEDAEILVDDADLAEDANPQTATADGSVIYSEDSEDPEDPESSVDDPDWLESTSSVGEDVDEEDVDEEDADDDRGDSSDADAAPDARELVVAAAADEPIEEPDFLTLHEDPPPARPWVTYVLIVLALVGIPGQVLWYQYDEWTMDPQYRNIYERICDIADCTLPQMVDVGKIESKNKVVRSHPDVTGALVVDVLIVNNADFVQPYPTIELTFSTLEGKLVAGRRFVPEEYLSGELTAQANFLPGTPVHVSLEVKDPGESAVNYNINFL